MMRLFFFVTISMFAVSCTDKTEPERCDELIEYFEGRETTIPRECETDADCEVVFVRPDHPFAAAYQPDDAALDRAVLSYRQNCGPMPRAEGELSVECVERFLEFADLEGSGSVQRSQGRSCVLRGEYEVPGEADVGEDVGTDVVEDVACGCTSASDCVAGEQCHSCECVPSTLCGNACVAADQCDSLDALGIGSSATVCASSCEAALEANLEQYSVFVECLRDSACARIAECTRVLP